MEMTKDIVERSIERTIGQRIAVSHKGNHRWESEPIETTNENSGIFAAYFKTISVSVQTMPCNVPNASPNPALDGWNHFILDVRWNHKGGGSNGAALNLYYVHATDELLTHEEASKRFQ